MKLLIELMDYIQDNWALKMDFIIFTDISNKAQELIAKEKENQKELIENLADLEHKRWSGWQTHCHKILRENCPSNELDKVLERWDKQIATKYKDLSEREKEMDRVEARKTLELITKEKSLAELADEKGFNDIAIVMPRGNDETWAIRLYFPKNEFVRKEFYGKTLDNVEQKAFKYLKGFK